MREARRRSYSGAPGGVNGAQGVRRSCRALENTPRRNVEARLAKWTRERGRAFRDRRNADKISRTKNIKTCPVRVIRSKLGQSLTPRTRGAAARQSLLAFPPSGESWADLSFHRIT